MHDAYTKDGTIHRRFNAQLQKAEPEAPIDGFFVKCAGRQACVLSSFTGKSRFRLFPVILFGLSWRHVESLLDKNLHNSEKSGIFANKIKDMSKAKKQSKLAQWWQRWRGKMQDTRTRTKNRYDEWHRRQKYYDDYAPAEPTTPHKAERITMLTVIRILLAELGEKEYWRTIWHLVWRPGYAIADYLNGKRRQFLRPFQLLIGTTLLLGLAVFIVPAERAPRESLTERYEQQLQQEEMSREAVDFVRKALHTFDAYREWNDEHMAAGLLTRSIWVIFFTWLLFRKSPREEYPTYNFAEILTAQIFIIAQLQTVNVAWILVTGWFVPTLDFHPYAFPNALATIIVFIDYQQLFGRKWYNTLWRTLLCVIW